MSEQSWNTLEKTKKQLIILTDSVNIVGFLRLYKLCKVVFVFLFLFKEYCEAWTSKAQGERPLLSNM